MAGNAVKLEFAGDSRKLEQAAQRAARATEDVGTSATSAGDDFNRAAAEATDYTRRMGDIGEATTGALDGIDALGGGLQAVADIQDHAREAAQRLARANVDVMQATEDMAQAQRDASQAGIDAEQAALDLEQATLDEATALKEYNAAVKEHGAASDEAKQAKLDMAQASLDVLQAEEDAAQATRDLSQANIDAKGAQVDLNDAMHEANPPDIQQWADKISMVTPLLSAMVGVVGLVTAAQWAWNAAQLASPTTWIVLGIGALIVAIVLLVKNWDKVKAAGGKAWSWIKDRASDAWGYIKKIPDWVGDRFSKIGAAISRPFRSAFNNIAYAWNNTIGQLSWSVPGWVPVIGGNSISVPHLPTFHSGGVVPGVPGSNQLALLQAGERVLPATSSRGEGGGWVVVRGDAVIDALTAAIASRVSATGGRAAQLGIRTV